MQDPSKVQQTSIGQESPRILLPFAGIHLTRPTISKLFFFFCCREHL